MSQSIDITLIGRSFTIRTDDDPEQLHAAANMVQTQIDELRQLGSTVASDRLMALVALNLAGDLLNKNQGQVEDLNDLLSALDDVVLQAEGLVKVPLR
ncbi:MAG: cell division protein ZapA [Mariprofundaceae bacterium]